MSDDVTEANPGAGALRRTTRYLLPMATALLALPLLTAAHDARPAPYGDRIAVHAAPGARSQEPLVRTEGHSVRAYDAGSGAPRWTYTRPGRRALSVHAAPGHAFALWSDGMVTDTVRAHGATVRWHRAVPDSAAWLRAPASRRGAGVLQPLDPGARMLAVVTPRRIAAYRSEDGDLRWVLPARAGCAFAPARSLRRGDRLLIAQPCARGGERGDRSWQAQLIAVDDLGRIVPHRTPLGNALPDRPGKVFARPR